MREKYPLLSNLNIVLEVLSSVTGGKGLSSGKEKVKLLSFADDSCYVHRKPESIYR